MSLVSEPLAYRQIQVARLSGYDQSTVSLRTSSRTLAHVRFGGGLLYFEGDWQALTVEGAALDYDGRHVIAGFAELADRFRVNDLEDILGVGRRTIERLKDPIPFYYESGPAGGKIRYYNAELVARYFLERRVPYEVRDRDIDRKRAVKEILS